MKFRIIIVWVTILIISLLSTGCSSDVELERYEDLTGQLKIGRYYKNTQYFNLLVRNGYTMAFEYLYPNIDVDYVSRVEDNTNLRYRYVSPSGPSHDIAAWLESSAAPDIVVLSLAEYMHLWNDNLFVPLDTIISEMEIEEQLEPSIIAALTHPVDRQLYGYAPTYNTEALVYNKDLFEAAGVEEPHDGMTWEEMFVLAERVVNESSKPIAGISYRTQSSLQFFDKWLEYYAYPRGLSMYDPQTGEMTVNDSEWKKVWAETAALFQSGVFSASYQRQFFFDGDIAMTLVPYSELSSLSSLEFSVGAIPVPQFADYKTGNGEIDYVFTIRNGAQNMEEATTFIRYLLSDDFIVINSLLPTKNFSEHATDLASVVSIEPFREFILKPNPYRYITETAFQAWSNRTEFFTYIIGNGEVLLQAVTMGTMTIEAALAEWTERGNQFLQEAIEQSEKSTIF